MPNLGEISSLGSAGCGGLTPLHVAAMAYPDNLNQMVIDGANLNALAWGGLTPLHLAILAGYYDSAKILIELGNDTVDFSDSGFQSLHFLYSNDCFMKACEDQTIPRAEREEIAAMLLEKGAHVNDRDNYGATPLHYAAMDLTSPMEKISELMALNADAGIRDNSGAPAWFYAALVKNASVAEYLRILAGHSLQETSDDGLNVKQWVVARQSEVDSLRESFGVEPIYKIIDTPSGLSFHATESGLYTTVVCAYVAAVSCSGTCLLGMGLVGFGAVGFGACGAACLGYAAAICYLETATHGH